MQGPAWRHPLVRVGDYVIVHRPHGLMASLRHQFALRVIAEIGEEEALSNAEKLWTGINLPNLQENILPTRQRASLILTKGAAHAIEQVKLRK